MTDEIVSHPNLAAALAALQRELPKVLRAEEAIVKTERGPGYRYTYANLATVSAAVLPLLGKHGLAFICRPTVLLESDKFVLAYDLLHDSGEGETTGGYYPLPTGGSPQQLGSAITYGRRYCLCAVTGVAPEEDDDDASATEPAAKPAATRKMSRKKTEPTEPEPITDPQSKKLHATFNDLGITERGERLAYSSKVIGRAIESSKDLTKDEATKLIDVLDADISSAIPALNQPEEGS